MKSVGRIFLLCVFTAFIGGCTYVPTNSVSSIGGDTAGAALDRAPNPDRVRALSDEFLRMDPSVSQADADRVARTAVYYSEQLADSFDQVQWVELQNVLVNLGLRPGGLCFQYAENMLAELRSQPITTLEFQRGIAWKGKLFDEHNCVVVTAVGQSFEKGIVIDAWRNAGHVRWAPVSMDHYPWQPKPPPAWEPTESPPKLAVPQNAPADRMAGVAPPKNPVESR